MESIRTNRILFALPDNVMDWQKVEKYAKKMRKNDMETGHHGFPPILGFFDVVNSSDVGQTFNTFNEDTEEKITKKMIGLEIFRVSDGNHRVCAAQKVGIWSLEVEIDRSGYVYTNNQ